MRDRLRSESGTALITAILVSVVIMGFSVLLAQLSVREVRQASFQEHEDVTLAATEAMLERYASKLTQNPAYFFSRVDEAERSRLCTASASPIYNMVIHPGNDWDSSCGTWDYVDPPDTDGDGIPDWWVHPLFDQDGDPDTVGPRDAAVLMEVSPPRDGNPVEVTVVGRRGESINRRAITASIRAMSLAEFGRVAEGDINYGAGAAIHGPVYAGGDLEFDAASETHYNIYAEGRIRSAPQIRSGARLFDSGPNYEDIRDAFPEPLNFNKFWGDLDLIRRIACDAGAGICLNDSNATGWMIHPYVQGGVGRIKIWKSTYSSFSGCLNSETWWMVNAEPARTGEGRSGTPNPPNNFNTMWTEWGDVPYPAAGVLWSNQHLVVGYRGFTSASDANGDGFREVLVKGGLTVYAGSSASPKNITVNADIRVADEDGYTDVLGLAASKQVIINPYAIGTTDRQMELWLAWLGQSPDSNRMAYSCGLSGNPVAPNNSTLDFYGSRASRKTESLAGGGLFTFRNYGFDDRLEFLRPPFWPLLVDRWNYQDWREHPLPEWASITG